MGAPGLESRAGKSEGFWLITDPINQGEKIWFNSPLLCLSAGDPSCLTRPELKYFSLGYLTQHTLFLPSPCFTLKIRSGLKENCPLKPQLKNSFIEGNIFLLPSSPRDFHCSFPKFSLISPTILNSWIIHFLAGLIFNENILKVPGSM